MNCKWKLETRANWADASAVFVGFAAISVIWYIIYGKKHYKGPPITRIEHDVVL
jgi:hypothetical protein